jgi:hypothetical protein
MVQRKRVILRFNYRNGFRALRTAPGVREDLLRRAQAVAAAAGPGVEVLPVQTPYSRARVLVGPVTPEAARRVAPDNLLLRALEAGRA